MMVEAGRILIDVMVDPETVTVFVLVVVPPGREAVHGAAGIVTVVDWVWPRVVIVCVISCSPIKDEQKLVAWRARRIASAPPT